jgi:hypothetical protein
MCHSNPHQGILSTTVTASHVTQGRVKYKSMIPWGTDKGLDLWEVNLIELTVICAMAEEWEEPKCQPCGLTPVCWKQSQKVKISVLKWMIMKDWNPNTNNDEFKVHRYTVELSVPQYAMSSKTELGQVLLSLIILVIYTAGVEAAPNTHLISSVPVNSMKLNLHTSSLQCDCLHTTPYTPPHHPPKKYTTYVLGHSVLTTSITMKWSNTLLMVSGFCRGVNEMCTLWDFTQRRMVVCCQHFKTTYRYHLQGSSNLFDCRTAWHSTQIDSAVKPFHVSEGSTAQHSPVFRYAMSMGLYISV